MNAVEKREDGCWYPIEWTESAAPCTAGYCAPMPASEAPHAERYHAGGHATAEHAWQCLLASVTDQLIDATARADRAEAAIRTHRDFRGDDRCWMDDLELYAVLPEGAPDAEVLRLPERGVFLASCGRFCERFHARRQPPQDGGS